MLQGSREPFVYFVCDNCSTVQISSTDLDMTKYYNSSYYSLSNDNSKQSNFFVRIRNRHVFQRENGLFGNLLQYLFPIYKEHAIIGSLVKLDTRVLDIGCGNGDFLKLLHFGGLQFLTGIEPYLKESVNLGTHFHLIKGNLDSLDSKYDLIRLHHVFEHVPNPTNTLSEISRLMNLNCKVVLTIPISDYIFKEYRESAFLLQAPHHFHLFSLAGISELIRSSGFTIEKINRNAIGISNWMYTSELWKNDLTIAEASLLPKQIIPYKTLRKFKKTENELIKNGLGDNVTFVFSKKI
jgi:2-polyprenyl-3-methyl-5-hydroxy-6-metoxy-1,4-benzoquinol methylase